MLKNLMGETGRSTGLLILRLTAGILMATHGAGKMKMVFAGQFDGFPDPIGLGPHISLIGAALSEFVFALAVAAGAFTRISAIPVAFTMFIALAFSHGFRVADDGEKAAVYRGMYLCLIFTGGGAFSVDALLDRRRAAAKK
ncbi:thiosulfate dehydrogenase [quinone] large subunit [Gammaproteobacteria bacterium]|nr:thiosulfate dehydrogenase [quinone] large subunit [Gammaproteobacteria bacterium]